MSYTVAILGATGMVGQEMLSTLAARRFPVSALKLLASPRSVGRKMTAFGTEHPLIEATPQAFEGVDLVLASAGSAVSRVLAPEAVQRGAVVVDNTSEFRQRQGVPLVIPEINRHALATHQGIIANPNCSTAILLMALHPLRQLAKIERVIVSTYQSVSGAGHKAVAELLSQTRAVLDGEAPVASALARPIAFNLIPQIDAFSDDGYTQEELKFTHETRKIFEDPGFRISGTCVRVPVRVGHALSVNVEFDRPVSAQEARAALAAAPGLLLVDDPARQVYPQPTDAAGRDEVLVGRLRSDISHAHGLNFWVTGDNLRRGAALNAVLIAEALIAGGWLGR